MTNNLALYWLKRDFRLSDNLALTTALANHQTVVPIFVLEPSFLEASETSAFHVHAVTNALKDVQQKLEKQQGKLAIVKGEVVETLERLYQKAPFAAIYAHEEIGINRTYQRDLAVGEWCKKNKVEWIELPQTGVFRRLKNRDIRQKLWKQFNFDTILPAPATSDIKRLNIPKSWQSFLFNKQYLAMTDTGFSLTPAQQEHVQAVSETDAEKTLQSFLYERGLHYRGGISSPNSAMTAGSRLSVHFAWGTITGRKVYQAVLARKEELKTSDQPDAGKWRSSLTAFLSRLHWRDHFIQRLESEPQMEFQSLHPAYEALEYDDKPEFLAAWIAGKTGFPMVDACIRCLQTTGFINFRMRAMLTSFACHTLHIDWKLLDHPMARLYTDYEPGIHLSQLQMQASVVGINTIRVYSPNKQIIDQDPDTVFIKTWVPELREFTTPQIIEHRNQPLGNYPPQLVDWWRASKEMKERLWTIRKLAKTKELAKEVYDKHGSRKGPSTKKKKKVATKKVVKKKDAQLNLF